MCDKEFNKHILVVPDCLEPLLNASACYSITQNIKTIYNLNIGTPEYVIEKRFYLYCNGVFRKTEEYIFKSLVSLAESYTYDNFKEDK